MLLFEVGVEKLTLEVITRGISIFCLFCFRDAKAGKSEQQGWGKSTYVISKVGVSALSIVQQRIFDEESPNRNIAVNHVHPGYVATDMTQHKGVLTPEEGAKSALFAALEGDFKGKFVWRDCQIVDWFGDETPSVY